MGTSAANLYLQIRSEHGSVVMSILDQALHMWLSPKEARHLAELLESYADDAETWKGAPKVDPQLRTKRERTDPDLSSTVEESANIKPQRKAHSKTKSPKAPAI